MARVVFFSFDYDDVFRANQVRNSGTFVGEKRSGFRDKAEYEKVRRTGDVAIKKWIRRQMKGCSVTCVLIGQNTSKSRWVNFEIEESIANGMGLLGVYVHRLKDPRKPDYVGLFNPANPLDNHVVARYGFLVDNASDKYRTYEWSTGGLLARSNDLGRWVDDAARRAGR